MRFLYIKVLQILNQTVDLMLRIVPRVSHVTGIFTQLCGGGQCNWCPQRKLWGDVSPCPPRDWRPCMHASSCWCI